MKELTQQEHDALEVATHRCLRTGTLYRVGTDSTMTDFFGAMTLQWHRSGVSNDVVLNGVEAGRYEKL